MERLLPVLLLLSVPLVSQGGNFLLIPLPAHSHVLNMARIAEPLSQRGHTVHAVMNANCVKGNQVLAEANVTLLLYPHKDNSCIAERQPKVVVDTMVDLLMKKQHPLTLYNIAQYQSALLASEGEALFSDPTLMTRIKELNIDLVIVDGTVLSLYYYIVPYKLDLPYVTLMEFFHSQWSGVPDLPSFSPVMIGTHTDTMTFLQRVENTLKHFTTPFFCSLFPGSHDALIMKYAPEKRDADVMSMFQLQRQTKLWLLLIDLIMDYPRPQLPHVIHIGGLSTRPAQPLPAHLAHIADSAQGGLVIVSFGSILDKFPPSVTNQLLKAFELITDVTIIWKYNGPDIPDLPSHIHTLPWIPQNDLLGHGNTKLLVTHSGYNSQFEALYHGVPMVGIPVSGDQPYNAARMQAKGFGESLTLMEVTSEMGHQKLVTKIRQVLDNHQYKAKIEQASEVFHGRVQSPVERTIFWLEHVLNYGSEHLLSPGLQLPWYQYWLLDVAIFLFFVFAMISGIIYIFGRWVLKKCFSYNIKLKRN